MPAGVKHRFVLKRLLVDLHSRLQRPIHAVELGVASGNTSEFLLRELPFLHLTMVDRWALQQVSETGKYPAQWTVRDRTKQFGERAILLRGESPEIASNIPDESQDLVFIDANHQFKCVDQDIVAWLPKVKHGGIMSGHDIDGRKDLAGVWGVRRAVEKHFGKNFAVEDHVWYLFVNKLLT